MEVVVTAAVLIVLSATFLPLFKDSEGEASAVAYELGTWLDSVQRRSQLTAGQGCTVTFSFPNQADRPLQTGDLLAEVSPASCALNKALVPDGNFGVVRVYPWLVSGPTTLSFTTRGTVTATTDTVIRLLPEGSSAIRCLRISAILGIISVGSTTNASPDASTTCPDASYVSASP